jgi:FkbH-like protein
MSEPVRLVIWDLDETFWKGTLSEGGITEYVDTHHEIVVNLALRGIMSSICSKNDHATVESILKNKGLWEYFVFPSINWKPKGPRLRQIVEAIQLRPASVLFIDDNHGNRAEALDALPEVQVADADLLAVLLNDQRFIGKNDSELSRLKQYKLLEHRTKAQQESFKEDNDAFLRQSRIEVTINYDVESNCDRAIELINRTNQLNFTKSRLPEDAEAAKKKLGEQLSAFDARAGLVSVRDRFGDYGVCGFFLLTGVWGYLSLIHFVFSCRILGMGIEQWVYARIGKPPITVVGDVIAKLDFDPDWINIEDDNRTYVVTSKTRPKRVRLRGACELEVLSQYFGLDAASIAAEMVMWKDGAVVMRHHTALLAQSFQPPTPETRAVLSSLGALGEIDSNFLDTCEDKTLLIYSNITDVHCPLYRHKNLSIILPIWLLGLGRPPEWTDEVLESYAVRHTLSEDRKRFVFSVRDLLFSEFELVESSEPAFERMYREFVVRVPKNAVLVWVLPRDVRIDDRGELVPHERQQNLNRLAMEAAKSAENVIVLPYQEAFSLSADELRIDGHLDRSAYFRLFENICEAYRRLI